MLPEIYNSEVLGIAEVMVNVIRRSRVIGFPDHCLVQRGWIETDMHFDVP